MFGSIRQFTTSFFLLLLAGTCLSFQAYSSTSLQDVEKDSTKIPMNWFNLDPDKDKVMGLGTDRAYSTLLKTKKSTPIIVAVIDSGVDIEHEDLKNKVWVNEDEIPGNGKDDDNNGYIDDVNGWNFIGGKDGRNVSEDTHELTRVYLKLKAKYGDKKEKEISGKNKEEYAFWQKVKGDFEKRYSTAKQNYAFYTQLQQSLGRFSRLLKAYLDTEELSRSQLEGIDSEDAVIVQAKSTLEMLLNNTPGDYTLDDISKEIDGALEHFKNQIEYAYNVEFNPRDIVGDTYENLKEKGYGNNDVEGPDAAHGTHVAGIIAADRNNDLGIKGIADNVRIMSIRAVPNGDERDKDVANAILYAVDNGAHIINMSFGKSYSPDKSVVDEAVAYAEKKGVLLVHAAGNSSKDIDIVDNYPNRQSAEEGVEAKNWLEIGASAWEENESFAGFFSNYGNKSIDLFSPGVRIRSTVPNNKYEVFDGTSMAAPAVAGVAALIWSYYPGLTALEVKEILKKSSRKLSKLKVNKPGTSEKIKFKELSMTGGLVSAYNALKMADTVQRKKRSN